MIGTHNSATGERGKGLLSWLVTPFARTQDLTLVQQFYNGCRYFDIRLKDSKNHKETYFAHGLWKSGKDVSEALYELDMLAATDAQECYISITYEGKLSNVEIEFWQEAVKSMMKRYEHLILAQINVKKPVWTNLYTYSNHPETKQGFKSLDGTSWHTYIPLPRLWDWVFSNLKQFSQYDNECVLVDFL